LLLAQDLRLLLLLLRGLLVSGRALMASASASATATAAATAAALQFSQHTVSGSIQRATAYRGLLVEALLALAASATAALTAAAMPACSKEEPQV
jgi:hypothetical protein